ncbi:Swc3p KNAG_0D04730 [Huiozyma naganishii CBS 8797]|uniref:SWR1-complex protein 3 n=1 Tax=Huiozyma naganishii (strain ATCC MYA-139 / BCRC 22969 / CBS 8797 / KCTC 17520 / NBRC 10181 / NCYC 3082 / Yp74L-3) TaxID=1071383 RepID=J7RL34_HUIN7|nr:hypothetical protein KNAG_0D04730 [Kazachstania naganishii CBS 8797]CCK70213.1 hypothetical protein KNAG_0D04730 [Kazachstania naganishii CBS 8797]
MQRVLRSRSGTSDAERDVTATAAARGPSKRRRRVGGDSENDTAGSDDGLIEEPATGAPRAEGRPFELIADIPASVEEPHYNSILTHPLSVRDSAVLYSSLISSRRSWIRNYGTVFPLYWKKAVGIDGTGSGFSIKDKMQKMCECNMAGGPHSFVLRLFILKDEKVEERWATTVEERKREKQLKKLTLQEEKQLKREAKQRAKLQKKEEKLRKQQLAKEQRQRNKLQQEQAKQEMKLKRETKRKERKLKQTAPDPSPANDSQMIANLNLMAQKDAKLNALMGKVAGGTADKAEVEQFKKVIEIARSMVAPPRWNAKKPVTSSPSGVAPSGTDTKPADKDVVAVKGTATKSVKVEGQTGESPNSTGGPRKRGRKPKVETPGVVVKKRPGRKPKVKTEEDIEEDKLTAFQLKYMETSTLVIEFAESKHARYYLPKDSIIEYVPETDKYLLSWIAVHNKRELKRFARRKKVDVDSNDMYFLQDCPPVLFSSMTVTLSQVPKRFQPILLHSVNKVEDVRRVMARILEIGTRLSGYNVWYQLDGYDDAKLAEHYRVELNDFESQLRTKRFKRT